MKIVRCPKGGRVPEGYCEESCLNYPGKADMDKRTRLRRAKVSSVEKKIHNLVSQSGMIPSEGLRRIRALNTLREMNEEIHQHSH